MSARVEAMRARRAVEFLDVAAEYEARLESAKDKVRAARESGDAAAVAAARAEMRPIATEMHEFRQWARETGRPPAGRPGRDATIRAGA